MKIVTVERIIDKGNFSHSAAWRQIERQITDAIRSVEWPSGSGAFTLYDEPGKKRGKGSGWKLLFPLPPDTDLVQWMPPSP